MPKLPRFTDCACVFRAPVENSASETGFVALCQPGHKNSAVLCRVVACPGRRSIIRLRKWLVLRGRMNRGFIAAALGAIVVATSVHAEEPAPPGALYEIPLRGGLRAASAVIGDRAPADRSQFLLEVIRRVYDVPVASQKQRDGVLHALLTHLDRAHVASQAETIPLPLHPGIWTRTVFNGRADAGTLVSAILGSRHSALLYYGLLSLDQPTREWLAGQPDLIAEIATKHAAVFAVAAPALRVSENTMRLPGGDAANPVWKALVGRGVQEPAAFIRDVLTQSHGHLAYFSSALAQLTPAQVRFALRLDAPDSGQSIEATRRLFGVFDRLATNWIVEDRVFWRPTLDPALLVSELAIDASGTATLPGTRAFWKLVLESGDELRTTNISADHARALGEGEPVDFSWLCEQIFKGGQTVQRRPYEMVLFASRVARQITPENVVDAIEAVHAAGTHAALTAVLERAGVTDVAVFAKAVRRAKQLSAINDYTRANRALAQFQGSLALLTRAALRRSLSAESLSTLVSSLSAVELSDRGEYEGRLARWWEGVIETNLNPRQKDAAPREGTAEDFGALSNQRYGDAVGPLDRDVIRFLAGPVPLEPHHVDWEGTRYRVDLAWAEVTRLGRMLGERPRPYLSSALALLRIADALNEPQLTREAIREHAALADQVHQIVDWQGLDKAVAALRRSADSDGRPAQRLTALAPTLRGLADDLFARGLTELAYAVALGQPDGALVSAGDAAARHDFGLRLFGPIGAWRFPVPGADRMRDWHVSGSLLALDVRLADFALARVSSRPPSARPTLNDADRRVFIEAVALMEGSALTNQDRDTIVAAIRNGRARVAAARSAAELSALADEIRLNGPRRSLLSWTLAHDLERAAALFSPTELLWLGLERKPVETRLHAWGAAAEPRLGCLCLRLIDRRPLETLAGRWDSGIFASGFADLNLRLAETLADLQMPAPLLPSVLAAATLDLINSVVSRGQDDRRGLVEFVQALQPDRVELYLALLTTDGPLVPVEEVPDGTADGAVRKTEVSR